MSPRKLTPADKQEILNLYRQTADTTSTLAERYGVSSSTVSRFLKSELSEQEYENLIQQKRLARTQKLELGFPAIAPEPQQHMPQILSLRSEPVAITPIPIKLPDPEPDFESDPPDLESVEAISLGDMLGEDLGDEDDLDDEDEDDDLDEEDWDDDESEELEFETAIAPDQRVEILPFADAHFPRICYLVIDRTAELIARPLKDFSHLGSIPPEETQQKTLPVFDNHRVARRFSNRFQRVIKVPDGKLLQKTSSHLQAKGITRILLEGQVYSLPTP
jgi:hypothetical protein